MDIYQDSKFDECFEADSEEGKTTGRQICSGCKRPNVVCWCQFLSQEPVKTSAKIIILQHSREEKRPLRTAPMLEKGMQPGKCTTVRGLKFSLEKYDLLKEASENTNTVLLYPSPDAEELSGCVPFLTQSPCTLIVLDGTWRQAQKIYTRNKWLRQIKQVKVTHRERSQYIIHRQPMEHCLSTLESAALALSILEDNPNIMQTLLQPLNGMCDFQMQHGAVNYQNNQYTSDNMYKKLGTSDWYKYLPKKRRGTKTIENTNN